jgi:hypothetical protein
MPLCLDEIINGAQASIVRKSIGAENKKREEFFLNDKKYQTNLIQVHVVLINYKEVRVILVN